MPDSLATVTEASAVRLATFRLARRLRAESAIDAMSDAQFSVLAGLRAHGPHTLRELAERERVSAPSMNRTVNGLEAAGYVTRTTDDADRRKVNIALAPAGEAIVLETVRRRDAWLEEALASLSDADRTIVSRAAVILQGLATR
ncbi:MarR family transcriptional regulator [Microbacterium sp. X-17]|uniref:MarR family winged helix-turn-helix transcriptional regulator n=1 Tax=Microbacterium sp. X-17 TaxID=3144404 RepID=UPI0031F4BF36